MRGAHPIQCKSTICAPVSIKPDEEPCQSPRDNTLVEFRRYPQERGHDIVGSLPVCAEENMKGAYPKPPGLSAGWDVEGNARQSAYAFEGSYHDKHIVNRSSLAEDGFHLNVELDLPPAGSKGPSYA
ncbi:hypothetical protein Nepgr_017493 [Nepenthes gracilis]|uniref:Uncharacterized protein n=1 Tax=Nepenthes gracilis TaxID=150966 RepID=A0AAD3SR73_NEPGR|nr:hypothetical protein Nepgr_017493 [Nepenthes gracilis]